MHPSFLHWEPKQNLTEFEKTPLTLLSGFLGAGKTTLLNHLLAHHEGRRIAVLVNDLGEVNIDAALIEKHVENLSGPIGGMVELTSGCICCTIQTELLDALLHLVETVRPDHIVVEATGVAEPKSILQTLYAGNLYGRAGVDFLKIHQLITVIDAAQILTLLHGAEQPTQRRKWLLNSDRRRPLAELLLEQIECADRLLINKIDCVDQAVIGRIKAVLATLNPRAITETVEQGRISPASVWDNALFDEGATLEAAAWRRTIIAHLNHGEADDHDEGDHHHHHDHGDHPHDGDTEHSCDHDHHHEDHHAHHDHTDYGLTTTLYATRQPFREQAFLTLMREGLPGVIRAKGFFWSDKHPEQVGLLSIAGDIMRADYLGDWWKTMIDHGEARLDDVPPLVRKAWHDEKGDCRQELVFIGIDLDTEAITRRLNECLISS